MADENIRGAIRAKPDPMAIATKGRITTYEPRELKGILRCPVKPNISAKFNANKNLTRFRGK